MRTAYRALALVLCLLLAGTASAAGTDRGLIWRIGEGPGASYLVGSVHLGTPAMYPLPESIRQAWQTTETLVVEADPRQLSSAAVSELALSRGLYADGGSLRESLGPRRWEEVAAAAESLGLPPPLLLPQRPWLAFSALTVAAAQREGLQHGLGLEMKLVEQAGDRPLIELEGVRSQLDLLSGLAEEVQQALLVRLAEQVRSGEPLAAPLIAAWRQGDTEALSAYLDEEFPATLAAAREALLTRRNQTMAQRLDRLLADGRRHFVLLGAAHMVGPGGLVERLRRRGHELEQL